jgi:hypothetical protein
MAITNPWHNQLDAPVNMNLYDQAIKGTMIRYEISMTEQAIVMNTVDNFDKEIKKELMYGIMDEIVKSKCIEFTKSTDYASGTTHFRARLFALPDDQVRILRLAQVNNIT